jgi:nicotinamidase/pyrazinamidase
VRVLWDVDTQIDFMLPEGKLYVPGAEATVPAIKRLVEAARETEQEDPVPITLTPLPEHYLSGREFLLLKKSFDVFTNPNTERLLEHLDPDEIVVFGVATDVCDDAVIRAFLERGRKVVFVEDAARGLDEGRVATCTSAWREAGVELTTAERVISSFAG